MGTHAFWFWIQFGGYWVGAYILPVIFADKTRTLKQKPFAKRVLPVLIVAYLMFLIVNTVGMWWPGIFALGIIVWITVYVVLWSVYRARDIGWSKWWCLLLAVPLVNLLYFLVILFTPSVEPKSTTDTNAPGGPIAPTSTDVGNG